jgi:hypothetical protein
MDRDPDANRRLVGRYFDLLNESDLSTLEEILSPYVVVSALVRPTVFAARRHSAS